MTIAFADYVRRDGFGLAALVRRGEVSASELLEAALARIDEVDPRLNAVIRRRDAKVRAEAAKMFDCIPFTPLFNVTGQPAMSVPPHWNGAGHSIGMQFAGRLGDDATLIRLAAQLERAQPWFDQRPSGF